MDCQEARENLLALLDGELEETERANVAVHVEFCPDCAREMERLRALRAGLIQTVPAGLETLRLSPEAEQRIKARLRQERTSPGLAAVLARLLRPAAIKAAIPLLVVLLLAVSFVLSTRPLAISAQETLVVAPQAWVPDTDAALRVIVRETTSARPIPNAEIQVHLRPEGEREVMLYRGQTDPAGTAQVHFRIPPYTQDPLPAELVVSTSSSQGSSQITQQVVLTRPFRVYLYSDKPVYRPGQTIHQRVLVLDPAHRLPAGNRMVQFSVIDPEGETIWEEPARTSDYGIAAVDWTLAADAETGAYRLRAALDDTASERAVLVGPYEPPSFQVELSTAPYYLAGQKALIQVTARALDGTPLPGVKVVLYTAVSGPGRGPGPTVQGQTSENGIAVLELAVPQNISSERAEWLLQVQVTDHDKQIEWAGRAVPLAAQALIVDLIAEGGRLRSGVENQIYILTATPDGAPVSAQVTLDLPDGPRTLQTDLYGIATLNYRPTPGTQYIEIETTARDDQGRTTNRRITLSADGGPAQVLLRLDRAAYKVGETIQAQVLAGQGKTVYVDMVGHSGRQTLYTGLVSLQGGRGHLEIDISPDMVGTVELHAYQVLADGSLVRDARPAVIDAPQAIEVRFKLDQPTYHPGDVARVDIDTAMDGAPAQSALGIAIVDESVFALENRVPGFAKLFFLLEESLLDLQEKPQGLELTTLLDPSTAPVRAAQNLAARAAWAGLPASDLTVVRAAAGPVQESDRVEPLYMTLSAALIMIALGLWIVVIGWVVQNELPGPAVGRASLLLAGVATAVALPAGAFAATQLGRLSGAALGKILLALLGAAWLGTLGALGVKAWRRRDDRLQIAVLLTGAYGVLGGLLGCLAERGSSPGLTLPLLVAAGLIGLLLAQLSLTAALWLGGRRGEAALTATLVLLLVVILVLAGMVLNLSSPLARLVTTPQAYAGPLGWLTGCQPATVIVGKEATAEVQETVEVEKEVVETLVVEKEATKVVEKEVTQVVESGPSTATPTQAHQPAPTAAPQVTPAGETAQPLPLLEPLSPETIYWVPEAVTNRDGHLELSIALPGLPATWRLTALASTQQGQLGAGTAILLVRAPEPTAENN